MAVKSNRYVDPQGRVIIPSHIREALNLAPGNTVQIDLDDEGVIRIRPIKERCCVCGEAIDSKPHATVKDKLVCYTCAQEVARDMIRRV